MEWIINFFQSIWEMVSGVANFLVTMVTGLLDLFKMLPDLIADMTTAVGFLPAVLTTFFAISLTVTIVFLVAGRGQGGE